MNSGLDLPLWGIIFLCILLFPLIPFFLWWVYVVQKKNSQFYILKYCYKDNEVNTFEQGPIDKAHYDLLRSHPDVSRLLVLASGSKEAIETLINQTRK